MTRDEFVLQFSMPPNLDGGGDRGEFEQVLGEILAEERERCAEVCDEMAGQHADTIPFALKSPAVGDRGTVDQLRFGQLTAEHCARRIRAGDDA